MQKFTKISGIAAPLPIANVDTDMIIPKQFLTTIKRTGLGAGLFYEMRYDVQGNRIDYFILHRQPYDHAQIIVSDENFGCGSSREHAPWALLDFGIRCVIAPSFADIFFNNCFKNGILPIVLKKEDVQELTQNANNPETAQMTIDLEKQTITSANKVYPFTVDEFRKHCLLNGLDDIGLTLVKTDKIDSFEGSDKQARPWLFGAA